MSNAGRLALAALVASAALTGCWDDGDVTVHKQGVYKGAQDPLTAQAASRSDQLAKRFNLVQRDR